MNYSTTELEETQLLKDYSDLEKGAYLGAIASIATADRSASEEEFAFLDALADSAGLDPSHKAAVLSAAKDPANLDLKKCLDQLKGSDLKYSLITDIISFAKSDGKYTAEEQQNIHQMADYLGMNDEQFKALNQVVDAADDVDPKTLNPTEGNFLDKLGLGGTLEKAGISKSGLFKGLLGILGPIVLMKLMNRGGGRSGAGGGMMGGLGGMLGGLLMNRGMGGLLGGGGSGGGLLGGGAQPMPGGRPAGGGLGSLISILGGGLRNNRQGQGQYGGLGGLLGGLLGGNRRGGF